MVEETESKRQFDIKFIQSYLPDEDEFDKNKLESWKVIKIEDKRFITIQLKFSDPVYVSANGLPCQLEVSFGDGDLFISSKGIKLGKDLDEKPKLMIRLRQQKVENKATKVAAQTADTLKAVLEFLAAGGPILSFLFGAGTSQLWPMIEGMQLLVHYPMLRVDTSANLGMF